MRTYQTPRPPFISNFHLASDLCFRSCQSLSTWSSIQKRPLPPPAYHAGARSCPVDSLTSTDIIHDFSTKWISISASRNLYYTFDFFCPHLP